MILKHAISPKNCPIAFPKISTTYPLSSPKTSVGAQRNFEERGSDQVLDPGPAY